MKIILVGASGTIGSEVFKALSGEGREVIPVGRSSGEYRVDMSDRESVRALYERIGSFDAVVSASGHVAFAPFEKLGAQAWSESLGGKLMGQIHLVQEALPYIRDRGSFTLVSGVTSDEPIPSGVAASTVNRALEGFAMATATELPRGLRINVISPTLLKESEREFGAFFPGTIPVEGWKVGQAYKKAVLGIQTGQVFRVI